MPEPTQKERLEEVEQRTERIEALVNQTLTLLQQLVEKEEARTKEVCAHALRAGAAVSEVIQGSKPIQYGVGALLFACALLLGSMATGTIQTPWGSATFGDKTVHLSGQTGGQPEAAAISSEMKALLEDLTVESPTAEGQSENSSQPSDAPELSE